MAPLNAYEAARLEKIKKNEALLADLALKTRSIVPLPRSLASNKPRARTRAKAGDDDDDAGGDDGGGRRPAKKQRRTATSSLLGDETAPARSSARIAAAPKKQYHEVNGQGSIGGLNETGAAQTRRQSGRANRQRKSRQDTNRDISERSPSPSSSSILPSPSVASIQENWTNWQPVAPPPTRSTEGDATFHFADQPLFTPNKSPEEMLRQGVFGGSYYRPLRSRKLGITISDDWRELPAEWLTNLNKERYLYSADYDPEVNFFGVACGQSIEEWEAAGWIAHEFDVRGWFQWYTRFFRGRRCEDDERQVSRWRKCVGPTGRWRRTLLKKYLQSGVREVWDMGDEDEDDGDGDGRGGRAKQVSPVVHQTCLHWAFEVRQGHLDEIWENGGV